MADSGSRTISRLDLTTRQKTVLAERYQGHRFNSPNDLVLARNGAIYFTDPPYGLAGINESPLKEQPVNGVYRLDPDGNVTLIDGSLTFPNGILLSPDGRTLAVTLTLTGASQIYAIPSGGGEPRRLTSSNGIDTEPTYTPDGSTIYFTSDRSGGPL